MKTMIFPAGNKEADDYARFAQQRGEPVLELQSWQLPSIHNADFADEFFTTVILNDVVRLLCPAASVRKFMETFPHGLTLLGDSPIQRQMREQRDLMEKVERMFKPTCRLTQVEVAGLLQQASLIYGESNDEKIMAMIDTMACAKNGNVVEIGSLCGRTAFVLGWLAFRFGLGPLTTVDPWSAVEGEQKDSPPALTAMTNEWDWDLVAESYHVAMALLPRNNRHIRLPSAKAAKFTGMQISVLHIDGNHDYAAVKLDIDLWVPKLISGGWLILDDYIWAHGDGPRRIGDELLEREAHDTSYVAGNALFVRMK